MPLKHESAGRPDASATSVNASAIRPTSATLDASG